MADKYTATNTWMCYIGNKPYIYPKDNKSTYTTGSAINTGWHIIPNMLWKHFVTPAQWAKLIIDYEAYHVDSLSIEVFNMIPMTQQLAIQGNTIFTAFNNCIYALGYTDKHYETSWENWFRKDNDLNLNLLYKEGLTCQNESENNKRKILPVYSWNPPNSRCRSDQTYDNWNDGGGMSAVYPSGTNFADRPTGVIWDPFNQPEDLMELRPGKNSMKFSWESHPVDSHRWFNLDQIAWWHPYTPEGPYNPAHQRPFELKLTTECDPDILASQWENDRQPINDYTIPNWAHTPICPMMWWWKEIQQSICPYQMKEAVSYRQRINQFFVGTEDECYKYGPTQMFMKMIPLFDSQGTHVECTANVSVKTTLNLSVKKRRTAIYAPTWGPFNWYDLYTAQTVHQRFAPSLIRYRTAGMRRTWQNLGDTNQDSYAHPRETPFKYDETVNAGTGAGSTRMMMPTVSYSAKTDSVTITTDSRKRPIVTPRISVPTSRTRWQIGSGWPLTK